MMESIQLNLDNAWGSISRQQVFALEAKTKTCIETLYNGTGKGNGFLGWLQLPASITEAGLAGIEEAARTLRRKCDVVVVIGIGGSYLGAKAVLEALNNSFDLLCRNRKDPVVLYAGQHISEDYLYELSGVLEDKSFGLINISKSGTTTEPALAFRILRQQLESAVGKDEARSRIVAVTDPKDGALRQLATREGYRTFSIPPNVGGRYSALTPVGLLPVAVAGIDIRELVKGAADMQQATGKDVPFSGNIAAQYAAARHELYRSGKKIEILANFHPKLHYIGEWWKQLYGESEGKEHQGIFPASVDLTTDLHSMGQFLQDGARVMFETVVDVEKPRADFVLEKAPEDFDGLNYLAGKTLGHVNRMAMQGTVLAHTDGGVPVAILKVPSLAERDMGYLVYFLEKACAISGYLLGVNPFNQPGVESYKKNMFALLGKPGYEEQGQALARRLEG
jgi:glucose-6-phosphate isomerase